MILRRNSHIESSAGLYLKSILKLIFSFACIFLFMLVLAPQADKLEVVKPMVNNIDEQGIDASALFYTELDEFSCAEINVRSSMQYNPKANTELNKNKSE